MDKKLVSRVLFILVLCFCISLKIVCDSKQSTAKIISTPVLVTAAHIPENQFEGYTLMYKDIARDTAYYIKDDYSYTCPEIGETVFYSNLSTRVVDVSEGLGFYVEIPEGSNVYQGLSGTKVKNKEGDEIAFISQLKDGKLFCISVR